MQTRIKVRDVQPEAVKAMMYMEKYIASTKLLPLHKELIKIRASQINGCAYCIDMHTKEARKLGETEQRIYLMQAWKETATLFTEEEKAILALTEEVTLISHHVSDETYRKAASFFDEEYLAQIIMMITTINMWNRIAITCQMQPGE